MEVNRNRNSTSNDLHKYLGFEFRNGPCITQLQTVVEKGFTNVLEIKTTKMGRGTAENMSMQKNHFV